MQDDPNKARIAANVRKMEAAKAPLADIEAYLQSEGLKPTSGQEAKPDAPSELEREARKKARLGTNQAEREALNTASTSFINFLDAGTFGLAGLATDALSPGSFRDRKSVV